MTELVIPRGLVGGLGRKLGQGGQARIYAAPGLTLPDAPSSLVFKEYKDGSNPPHGLRALVAVRNRVDATTRARLDALTCWPLRIVEDGGVVCGVVLPLIPPSFLQHRELPGTGSRTEDPREVQNLIVAPAMAKRFGMPCPTAEQRMVICRDFAAAVHLVHRLDLVIGDVNARNALYRIPNRPAVMLLDCDAIRIKGNMSVVAQLNAPDWNAPEGGRALTQATDRYKLGLFILRCLSPGKLSSVSRDPSRADAVLDEEGRCLMRAALQGEPAARPTAQDWGRYLERRISGRRQVDALPVRPSRIGGPRGLRRDSAGVWRPVD